MKTIFLFLWIFSAGTCGFAAEAGDASPSPPDGISSADLSQRISTDDLTYAAKIKARKERQEYEATVKAYNEMIRQKAVAAEAAAAAVPPPDNAAEEEKALRNKQAAAKMKPQFQKRVLVS